MPRLTDLVRVIPPDAIEEPEDIFAFAPGLIFTDDLSVFHGDPDSTIEYTSPRFGKIELKTADPEAEHERKLFSHYLWNAGIKLAGLISDSDDSRWSVKGETVLEFGAGTGLVGIVATLAEAKEVTLSDYPAQAVLANLRANAAGAIPSNLSSHYQVQGHEWGDLSSTFPNDYKQHYTTILAADCFWMPYEHQSLVRSMLHFLTLDPRGRIFVVSGFHTGRATLAKFFDVAMAEGLEVEDVYEEDDRGTRREWVKERDDTDRKKWLMIARLRR